MRLEHSPVEEQPNRDDRGKDGLDPAWSLGASRREDWLIFGNHMEIHQVSWFQLRRGLPKLRLAPFFVDMRPVVNNYLIDFAKVFNLLPSNSKPPGLP